MKIYLAARYSRREQLVEYKSLLESLGHDVTSRWLLGEHQIIAGQTLGQAAAELGETGFCQAAEALRARFAKEDWMDLMAADVCVSFTEKPRETKTRGGRHVEFGAALAFGKICIVVGWRENVFHHLPAVRFVETFEECLPFFQSEEVA